MSRTREDAGGAPPLSAERGTRWRAAHPLEISWRGWLDILTRCARRWGPSNILLVAGGVSFFVILSAGPALVALASFYAILADAGAVAQHAKLMRDVLPPDAFAVFESVLLWLTRASGGSLAVGAVASLAFALWGANSGMRQFCAALTIVQDETVERSLTTQIAVSIALTLGAIFIFAAAALTVALAPALLDRLRLGGWEGAIYWANWLVLVLASTGYGAVIYRYGPDRNPAAWRWVLPGAVAAAIGWAAMSQILSLILRSFEGFNRIYGPLAGVVTMMLWVLLSTLIFLLGALLNAEAERQTVRDTTDPPEKPLGARGAVPADEVGAHPDIADLRRRAAQRAGRSQAPIRRA
jgi:membrane protein